MRICNKEFSAQLIDRITQTIQEQPQISRTKLSRQVCEWMDWRSLNGKLQEVSCRKALAQLNHRGILHLPRAEKEYAFQRASSSGKLELADIAEVNSPLEDLGEIEVLPVSNRYSKGSKIWNALMDQYHYLGKGPLCGAQIRYLIKSNKYGWLGGLSFSAASFSLKSRDEWIGWTEAARRENINYVVCNSRFLIIPLVKVSNLASYIMARCLTRLASDWQERYGYVPVLAESFVDAEYFDGASYRAANWLRIGQSSGRRDSLAKTKGTKGKKDIYLYPLSREWKKVLCQEKEKHLSINSNDKKGRDWAEQEFGGVDFYDPRLEQRLYTLARDFYQQPGQMIPQACNGSLAKTKGAYRFFNNKQVNMDKLLRPHIESSIGRLQEQDVVLAVQDTTTLDYTNHPGLDGIGPISTRYSDKIGLIVHETLAFTKAGVPLGLLDVQCWARDKEKAGKRYYRKELPIEEKESIKWLRSYRQVKEISRLCPATRFVSIGDREADIYELFTEVLQEEGGAELLVRACRNRQRKVEDENLWDKMKSQPIAGHKNIKLSRKGNRPAREAELEIRYAKVQLLPPKDKKLPSVSLWAIYVSELASAANEPIEWMLLTTIETGSFTDACEKVAWYARRWGIENFHRILKSGCRIEDRQLEDSERIKSCLTIDMVIAWRVYYLTTIGRDTPHVPCTMFFEDDEWKALYWYIKKTEPPEEPPTLSEMTRILAKLGGFLGRKADGHPGQTVIWRALIRLEGISEMYKLMNEKHRAP